MSKLHWSIPCRLIAHHYTFIDRLLPESFQTTAGISRVGHACPDFFQGGRLPAHPAPTCRRPDSYIAEGPREALRQLKSHQLLLLPLHKVRKITVEKACKRRMTLKATQGHWKPRDSIGHASLPITPFRSSGLEMKPAYFCPSPHRSIKIKRPNFSPVLLTKRYNSYWH